MIFHVVIEKDEDGWIVAECPSLPGCVSQGKTGQEALENIKEAITAWLWAEDQKAFASLPLPRASEAVLVSNRMGKLAVKAFDRAGWIR